MPTAHERRGMGHAGGTASPKAVLLDARFMDPENTEDWAHLLAGLQDQELLRLLKPEVATLVSAAVQ